jgi:hypothetical protein
MKPSLLISFGVMLAVTTVNQAKKQISPNRRFSAAGSKLFEVSRTMFTFYGSAGDRAIFLIGDE